MDGDCRFHSKVSHIESGYCRTENRPIHGIFRMLLRNSIDHSDKGVDVSMDSDSASSMHLQNI